jgi:hypothetical protein
MLLMAGPSIAGVPTADVTFWLPPVINIGGDVKHNCVGVGLARGPSCTGDPQIVNTYVLVDGRLIENTPAAFKPTGVVGRRTLACDTHCLRGYRTQCVGVPVRVNNRGAYSGILSTRYRAPQQYQQRCSDNP